MNYITRGSNRHYDDNGFLHVENCILTSEEVAGYLGQEIQGYAKLGLDPDKIYGIYRPAEEIEKAATTFNNIPLTDGHILITPEKPNQSKWIGATGSDAVFKDGKLYNSIAIYTQKAIDQIESADKNEGGKKDLSCGYSYDLVPEEGQFKGRPFQFRMVNLKGNHLAHVEEGRNPHAMIADNQPNFLIREKMKSLAKLLFSAFAGDEKQNTSKTLKAIKAISAQDDASFVGGAVEKANAIIALVQALDEEPEKKEMMVGLDMEDPEEQEKPKLLDEDDEEEEKDKKEAKDEEAEAKEEKEEEKKAEDEEEDKEEEREKAMDEAIRVREKVISLCNKVVGKMSEKFVMDSTPEIMIDNALTKNSLNINGKSLEAKVAMLETLVNLKESQKPKKSTLALDSNRTVPASSFIPLKRGN